MKAHVLDSDEGISRWITKNATFAESQEENGVEYRLDWKFLNDKEVEEHL
jgi:hypothetical protein